jgi:hypothetical protein
MRELVPILNDVLLADQAARDLQIDVFGPKRVERADGEEVQATQEDAITLISTILALCDPNGQFNKDSIKRVSIGGYVERLIRINDRSVLTEINPNNPRKPLVKADYGDIGTKRVLIPTEVLPFGKHDTKEEIYVEGAYSPVMIKKIITISEDPKRLVTASIPATKDEVDKFLELLASAAFQEQPSYEKHRHIEPTKAEKAGEFIAKTLKLYREYPVTW